MRDTVLIKQMNGGLQIGAAGNAEAQVIETEPVFVEAVTLNGLAGIRWWRQPHDKATVAQQDARFRSISFWKPSNLV